MSHKPQAYHSLGNASSLARWWVNRVVSLAKFSSDIAPQFALITLSSLAYSPRLPHSVNLPSRALETSHFAGRDGNLAARGDSISTLTITF
jgi:hypothetical protein